MRRVIPVIAVICHDTVLMIQRNNKYVKSNAWCLPGGKIEEGESVVDCAKRELKEETGIIVNHADLVELGRWDARTRSDIHFVLFQVNLEERPRIKIEDKFDGYGWFAKEINIMEPFIDDVFMYEE